MSLMSSSCNVPQFFKFSLVYSNQLEQLNKCVSGNFLYTCTPSCKVQDRCDCGQLQTKQKEPHWGKWGRVIQWQFNIFPVLTFYLDDSLVGIMSALILLFQRLIKSYMHIAYL